MIFPWIAPWATFFAAWALTWALTPQVRKLAFRYGAVAVPRERDIHRQPLARWGGLAMVGAFLVTLGLAYAYIVTHRHSFPWDHHQIGQFAGVILAAMLVAVVGTLDDKFEISALWQTLALVTSGIILSVFDVRIDYITNPFPHSLLQRYGHYIYFRPFSATLGTVIWVFLVAKTVDFLDGLDGLAAGVCAICATTLALMSAQAHQYEVTIIATTLVGCCLGFLRYNYNPAKIIMGTVGAQFLGFVLAAIAIIGTFKIAATVSVALPILVLGVPIFDGLRVVTQRALKHTPAYLPDKTSHIHHLLINRGLSQKRAVWIIYALTACFCAAALALFRVTGR